MHGRVLDLLVLEPVIHVHPIGFASEWAGVLRNIRNGLEGAGATRFPDEYDRLRAMCDQAIESARSDGRKTVLDRDFS